MSASPSRLNIRWMVKRDMEEVQSNEDSAFAPWSVDDFTNALRMRNCIGMVGELPHGIVCHMVWYLFPKKIMLANFTVGQYYRRNGYGTQLLARLKQRALDTKRGQIIACIDEYNLDAQLFLRENGFHCFESIGGGYLESNEYLFRYVAGLDEVQAHRSMRGKIGS